MLLNPNCSELVTQLDITDLELMKDVFRKIEAETDYRVCIRLDVAKIEINKEGNLEVNRWGNSIFVPIDVNKIRFGVERSDEGKRLMIPKADVGLRDDILNYGSYSWGGVDGEFLRLFLANTKKITDTQVAYITFETADGYTDKKGLVFELTQHCCTNEFPIFHRIRELFGSDYQAHDGGTAKNYEGWVNYWSGNIEAIPKEEFKSKKEFEEHIDHLKSFPPLKPLMTILPKSKRRGISEIADKL